MHASITDQFGTKSELLMVLHVTTSVECMITRLITEEGTISFISSSLHVVRVMQAR